MEKYIHYSEELEKYVSKLEKKIMDLESVILSKEEGIEPVIEYMCLHPEVCHEINRIVKSYNKYGPDRRGFIVPEKEFSGLKKCLNYIYGEKVMENILYKIKSYKNVGDDVPPF